jgi:hypothetical protein
MNGFFEESDLELAFQNGSIEILPFLRTLFTSDGLSFLNRSLELQDVKHFQFFLSVCDLSPEILNRLFLEILKLKSVPF